MSREDLIEQLAEKEHGSWSHWMNYLFSRCIQMSDGSMVIHPDLVRRWLRLAKTPYAQLSEQTKQSDRNRVALILPLIEVQIMSVKKRRTLRIAFWIMLFVGGMIAGQLLLFRDALMASSLSVIRVAYWIEDAFFFLSALLIAVLTFRVWWPYV